MTAWNRVQIAALAIRRYQPRTYWQVWLSTLALPLAALIVGGGLRLIFRTWPEFDGFAAVETSFVLALIGASRSLALRRRRQARRQLRDSR